MLIQPYMSGMSFLCGLRASVRSLPLAGGRNIRGYLRSRSLHLNLLSEGA